MAERTREPKSLANATGAASHGDVPSRHTRSTSKRARDPKSPVSQESKAADKAVAGLDGQDDLDEAKPKKRKICEADGNSDSSGDELDEKTDANRVSVFRTTQASSLYQAWRSRKRMVAAAEDVKEWLKAHGREGEDHEAVESNPSLQPRPAKESELWLAFLHRILENEGKRAQLSTAEFEAKVFAAAAAAAATHDGPGQDGQGASVRWDFSDNEEHKLSLSFKAAFLDVVDKIGRSQLRKWLPDRFRGSAFSEQHAFLWYFRFWLTSLAASLPYVIKETSDGRGLGVFPKKDGSVSGSGYLWRFQLIGWLFELHPKLDFATSINSILEHPVNGRLYHLIGPLSLVNHLCRRTKFNFSQPRADSTFIHLKAEGNARFQADKEILVKYTPNTKDLRNFFEKCLCRVCAAKSARDAKA